MWNIYLYVIISNAYVTIINKKKLFSAECLDNFCLNVALPCLENYILICLKGTDRRPKVCVTVTDHLYHMTKEHGPRRKRFLYFFYLLFDLKTHFSLRCRDTKNILKSQILQKEKEYERACSALFLITIFRYAEPYNSNITNSWNFHTTIKWINK